MHTEVSYARNKILHLAQTKTVSQPEYTQGGYNEKAFEVFNTRVDYYRS